MPLKDTPVRIVEHIDSVSIAKAPHGDDACDIRAIVRTLVDCVQTVERGRELMPGGPLLGRLTRRFFRCLFTFHVHPLRSGIVKCPLSGASPHTPLRWAGLLGSQDGLTIRMPLIVTIPLIRMCSM